MYNSQYYTCEQIDERLLQGYLDDYNTQTGQSLTKAQFLTKLGSLFSKEGVIDNTATQIGYYECDTAAGTAAKVLSVASYALFAGGAMKVKFVNKNTANNATLNINSQGAKALYYQGERASATNSWDAEEVVEIYYDGTSYYANNAKFTAAQWAAINSGITDVLVTYFRGKADCFLYSVLESGEFEGLPRAETYMSSDGEPAQMRYIREDDGIYIVFLDSLLNATVYSSNSPESEYFFCDGTKNIYSWEDDSMVRNLYPEFFACEEGRENIEITWSELKALRDGGLLTAGQGYRITDYTCTTIQKNTQSAGHVFDIIVRADSTNALNENAYAAKHAGDTYFADSKLEAWKLLYCLDNDTDRFVWADSTNGKGVIYRMIDENDNECPYDFKNIQFKVGANTTAGTVANVFYYTFSVASGTNDATVTDHSLHGGYCCRNKFGERTQWNIPVLNEIIFRNTSASSTCICNTFESGSYRNTFGNNCNYNTFGKYCYSNTFGDNCSINTFGNYCYSNTFGSSCGSNTFGNNCNSNMFSDSCGANTFGNNCNSNTFGSSCYYNTFGSSCSYIKFGTSSTTKDYCRYIIVENGNQYLYLGCSATTSSYAYFQNVKIAQGVNNTRTYKTITHTTAGDTFQTVYKPANSVEVSV